MLASIDYVISHQVYKSNVSKSPLSGPRFHSPSYSERSFLCRDSRYSHSRYYTTLWKSHPTDCVDWMQWSERRSRYIFLMESLCRLGERTAEIIVVIYFRTSRT